jgi:hypothetical protein
MLDHLDHLEPWPQLEATTCWTAIGSRTGLVLIDFLERENLCRRLILMRSDKHLALFETTKWRKCPRLYLNGKSHVTLRGQQDLPFGKGMSTPILFLSILGACSSTRQGQDGDVTKMLWFIHVSSCIQYIYTIHIHTLYIVIYNIYINTLHAPYIHKILCVYIYMYMMYIYIYVHALPLSCITLHHITSHHITLHACVFACLGQVKLLHLTNPGMIHPLTVRSLEISTDNFEMCCCSLVSLESQIWKDWRGLNVIDAIWFSILALENRGKPSAHYFSQKQHWIYCVLYGLMMWRADLPEFVT